MTTIFDYTGKMLESESHDVSDKSLVKERVLVDPGSPESVSTHNSVFDTYELVKEDVLRGAKTAEDSIEIQEGFTAKVTSGKVELVWDGNRLS